MANDVERNLRRAEDARAAIEFEDDPHRAALEDDPEHTEVSFKTWLAIFVRLPQNLGYLELANSSCFKNSPWLPLSALPLA